MTIKQRYEVLRLRFVVARIKTARRLKEFLFAVPVFLKAHFIDFHFYGGVVLVGVGASYFKPGLGLLVSGALVLLYVRSPKKWWGS